MTQLPALPKAELGAIIVRPVLVPAVWALAGVPMWEKSVRHMTKLPAKRKVASGVLPVTVALVGVALRPVAVQ